METIRTGDTSIRPPEGVDELATISRTSKDIAREIFNIRAIDIAYNHESVDQFLDSAEWRELRHDIDVMTSVNYCRELLADFLFKNLKIFTKK